MEKNNNFYTGLGKRKTSVAKVFLTEGSGIITVNKKTFDHFFAGIGEEKQILKTPLVLVNVNNQYDIDIKIHGGGITSQLEAVRLAISKALIELNPDWKPALKAEGLTTRDPRMVERKKFGQKKARARFQFSKR